MKNKENDRRDKHLRVIDYEMPTRLTALCIGFISLALISCNLVSVIWTPAPQPTTGAVNQITSTLPPPDHPAEPATKEPPPQANHGKRLVGYFTSWSIYARGYHAADIPAGMLTHLNYAFTIISD
ncbi:MAG: hypothetical protein ACM3PY_08480, partial [Omnitrophica WOR_2 bacterium]